MRPVRDVRVLESGETSSALARQPASREAPKGVRAACRCFGRFVTGKTASAVSGQPSRRAEEQALFAQLQSDPTGATRAAIAERFLPLVRHIARRYDNGVEPFEDLVQAGCVGLLQAIDRFEIGRGFAFSSLAGCR